MDGQIIYQGDETHHEVVELRESAHELAQFCEELGMDKLQLTRLWCALKPFGFDRSDCNLSND